MKLTQVIYLQRTGAYADYFEPCCGVEFENGDLLRLDVGEIVAKERIGKVIEDYSSYYIIHRFNEWKTMDCSFCNLETLLNYKEEYLTNHNRNREV